MKYRECLFFSSRFLIAAILLGIGLLSISCSQSKEKHLTRGEEYLQKRKFQEALMEFRSAAEIDKDSAEAHWGLARSYENLGQFYETINELQKVGELNPKNLDAKTKLGNYFLASVPPQIDETNKVSAVIRHDFSLGKPDEQKIDESFLKFIHACAMSLASGPFPASK